MGNVSLPINELTSFLDENKGEDITMIDLRGKSSIADYLVILSGISPRHLHSLAEKSKEWLHKKGIFPVLIEGGSSSEWVLVDGGEVIIHLFRPETRQLYNLEKMWGMIAHKDEVASS